MKIIEKKPSRKTKPLIAAAVTKGSLNSRKSSTGCATRLQRIAKVASKINDAAKITDERLEIHPHSSLCTIIKVSNPTPNTTSSAPK